MEAAKQQLQALNFEAIRDNFTKTQQLVSDHLTSIILTILIALFASGIIVKFSRFLKYLRYLATNPTFYFKEKNALVKDVILAKSIKSSTYTKEFTISVWVKINQYGYNRNKSKMIFCMIPSWPKNELKTIPEATVKQYQQPGVWFEPFINNIRITMLTKTNQKSQLESCIIYDVPINEWFFFTITLSNRGLDGYMNGKLVRTIVLAGDPVISQGNILTNYFGGFSGSIQKLQYSTTAQTPEQIQQTYNCGRFTSLLLYWFKIDQCPKTDEPNASVVSDKCSIKNFGSNLGQNTEMWYLPPPYNACNIEWGSSSLMREDNMYEKTNNNLASNGPTVGKDISCKEIRKKLKNNELKFMFNENVPAQVIVYVAEKNKPHADLTSGLYYKARHLPS